jgi:osmotically inducible protein OsmC
MQRSASASWTGGLKSGTGTISTQSGVLEKTQYGFNTRFEDGAGTNPEELIGAAHAGCFTMALAAALEKEGMTAKNLHTRAAVTLEKMDGGFEIVAVHLDLVADIPGADPASLRKNRFCRQSRLPGFKAAERDDHLVGKAEGIA